MAKTVKIPGVGSVPTKWAVVGGVAVVGIAGVAWWRYSNNKAAIAEEAATTTDFTGATGDETVYPAYSTDYAPDESYDGGAYPYPTYTTPSYGLTTTTQTADPTTNPEWTRRSIEHLELVGVDSQAASLAVSRYLLKECLTVTQADIVRQAVSGVGTPPQGTFSIVVCPSGTPGDGTQPPAGGTAHPGASLPAPGNLHVDKISRSYIIVDWNDVPGAKAYNLYQNGTLRYPNHPIYSLASFSGLKPGTRYSLSVRPVGDDGAVGPAATISASTAK